MRILKQSPKIDFKHAAILLLAGMASIGLNMNLDPGSGLGLVHLMVPDRMVLVLLECVVLCCLLSFCSTMRFRASTLMLAAILAFSMTFGWACGNLDNPWEMLKGQRNLAKALWHLASWLVAGYAAAESLFCLSARRCTAVPQVDFFDRWIGSSAPVALQRFAGIAANHPMLVSASVLALLWLPLLVGFYPGLLAPGDTGNQIAQFYGYEDATAASVNRLDPDIMLM